MARLRQATPICVSWGVGDTSTNGRPISEAGLHSEVAYLKGSLEAERGRVYSFRAEMSISRGRLAAMSSLAVRVETWVLKGSAPKPEVNDEDEQLGSRATSWIT